MSVADQSVPQSNAGRVRFTVRFSPQFVNRMCDRLRRSLPTQANVAGLLFGRLEADVSEVQVFRSAPEGEASNDLAGPPGQLNEMVERLIASSHKDPEVSALTLLGWYSFRATGGLHESDVAFHNRFFRQPNELALIVRPEQHPNVLFEIYSKSGATLLSEEEHRWGSLRLATDTTVAGPVDIAMRAKIGDDFYLRAYQVSKTLDRAERREHWISAVDATRSTFRSIFRQKRKESYARAAAAPAATPSATLNSTLNSASSSTSSSAPMARAAAAGAAEAASVSVARTGLPPSLAPAPQQAMEPAFNRRGRELAPAMAGAPAAMQKIVAGDPPALPAVIKPPKRRVPWLSSLVVFAIAATATFALYWQGFANSADTPRFLRALFPETGLSLRVEGEGDRVLLSWNRRNALVRASSGGVLHIDDGPQHRDVKLDAAQIANGSVLYRPGSDDVSFRLEIHGAQGAAIAETTRMLDGGKAAPLQAKDLSPDVSSPAPATTTAAPSGDTTLRDQHVRRDENAAVPVVKRPAPAQPDSSGPAAEYRPAPTRETNPPVALAPAPATGTSSGANAPVASNTSPAGQTPAKTTPMTANSQTPSPAPGVTQTTGETPKLTSPVVPPDTTTKPADTSKVLNWEDTTPSPKAAEATPPRTPPATTPEGTAGGATAEAKMPPTFVPPKPLKQVLPDLRTLTPGAIATAGQLEVAVRVNKKGHVTEAYLVGDASRVAPHLVRAALNAAKQWTFQPATIRGKNVASDHTIVFEFRPANR